MSSWPQPFCRPRIWYRDSPEVDRVRCLLSDILQQQLSQVSKTNTPELTRPEDNRIKHVDNSFFEEVDVEQLVEYFKYFLLVSDESLDREIKAESYTAGEAGTIFNQQISP